MSEPSVCFVYITAPTAAAARRLGRILVKERLVACVNIVGAVESIYWWNGAVAQEKEAIVIAKTVRRLARRLVARVKVLHSYTCPCIVLLPVVAGSPDYLRWVRAETVGAAPARPPTIGPC